MLKELVRGLKRVEDFAGCAGSWRGRSICQQATRKHTAEKARQEPENEWRCGGAGTPDAEEQRKGVGG